MIFKNNINFSGPTGYYSQCGWSGYTLGGTDRRYFRFQDSATAKAYKLAGNNDLYQIQFRYDTGYFAGIVRIKD
jgi:hypothetical protein